jgi:hypothetical protein
LHFDDIFQHLKRLKMDLYNREIDHPTSSVLSRTSSKESWQKNQPDSFRFFFFQLMLVVVSFSWFSLGKSWQELGSLLETKIFNQIDKGFEGVAAMNV